MCFRASVEMGFILFLLPIALLAGLVDGGSSSSGGADDDDTDVQKGGAADDELDGGTGEDLLAGFGGDDTLTGGAGADLLVGDTGDDVISGGDGRDLLLGGTGEDLLNGGEGADLLIGGQGEDRLLGDGGDDLVVDLNGSAEMEGGAGNDTLIGLGIGNDPALFEAVTQLERGEFLPLVEQRFGAQPDPFDRMLLRNVLSPSDEPSFDTMAGGAGNDVLIGDRGDFMTGGDGADVFSVFGPPVPDDPTDPGFGQVVTVNDFRPGEDQVEVQYVGSGDVTIGVRAVQGGVMVSTNDVDVMFLAGLQTSQLNAADVLLNRIVN